MLWHSALRVNCAYITTVRGSMVLRILAAFTVSVLYPFHSPQDVKPCVNCHISWHVLHVQWIHHPKGWPESSVGNGCNWCALTCNSQYTALSVVALVVWLNTYTRVSIRGVDRRTDGPILVLSGLWSNTAIPVVSLPLPAVVETTAEGTTVHAVRTCKDRFLQIPCMHLTFDCCSF